MKNNSLDNFYFLEKGANASAEPEDEPGTRDSQRSKTVGLIDWQLINVQLAPTDLCYFLSGSFSPETLAEMEGPLTRAYLDALAEANPSARKAFTQAQWDEAMQLSIIFQACKLIIELGGVDLSNYRSAKVMDMMCRGTFLLWERHNCADAIDKFVKGELNSQRGQAAHHGQVAVAVNVEP